MLLFFCGCFFVAMHSTHCLFTVMWCWTEIMREETGHHQFMASLTKYLFVSITSCLPSSMETRTGGQHNPEIGFSIRFTNL